MRKLYACSRNAAQWWLQVVNELGEVERVPGITGASAYVYLYIYAKQRILAPNMTICQVTTKDRGKLY